MTDKISRKHHSLATLITRIIFLVLGFIAIGIFVQSYYFSSRIIKQEVRLTQQQTSALVKSLLNNHLSILQIHHDSNSKNESIRSFFVDGDEEELEYYFLSMDQADPTHTPEFRFLTTTKGLLWDDGNAHFYGVNETLLHKMSQSVLFGNNWHFMSLHTLMGPRNMLVRRSPVIATETGEVLGQYYISVVLDNNFPLVEMLESGSNSDNIVMLFGDKVIAHSLSGREPYELSELLRMRDKPTAFDDCLISQTPIEINSTDTLLSVLAVQENSHVASLQRQHYLSLAASLILMLLLSLVIRSWIQNRVARALESLMAYSRFAGTGEQYKRFDGSDILEFSHIGHTLEHTFEQLESQRRSFQDLFNFALSPMMVWSESGLLIQVNPAAMKELAVEHSTAQDFTNPLFQLFKLKLSPHLKMAAQGATLTGINVPIGEKVFRWNLSPIVVENGISGIIVQGQDITTLIDAEKQSNLARREAENSAKTRADFLAKMSHEIRTPLNGILGIAQLLKRSVHDKESLRQVDVLCDSGEHLLAVLNDILDFSRIEQGKLNIKKRNFSFSNTVNTLENIYRPVCVEKNVQFIIHNQIPLNCQLYGDQVRLNQIMFNLISNAVKFTPSGKIEIFFELEQFAKTECVLLSIKVKDTGIGIDESKLDSIFEPFVQADSLSTREYAGSGLGLTIVKNLVEMLEGDISVSSKLGNGATFCVTLPVEKGEVHVDNPHFTERFETLFTQSPKVLLVEDNHTNAFILKAFCQKYRMSVEWVQDGTQALEMLREHVFDLIMMDNQLPKMGGIETTREIREQLKLGTPIYACTADAQETIKNQFLAAGANRVIVKPIKEHELHEALVHFKKNFWFES
ncbi:ATP-binding protein [Vibrio sp. IRLE0018]|uniref:quorum-sensing autoinducer 2 sensor kinase/phosphatase LuxQ n=1 Tax=Vibrio TaxID=662 RepID=UPI001593337F|nr:MULTISPECIES: quorum-sensing autoinducer 2 sensor kinase/phosphatase LuxQ [Vibrio]MCF8777563.1 ATP-binding protein [Vibrio floridensis]NVC61548.1 response regulator [Vibrio sp. 05-20-BW147]HAS6346703.1 response regulator [Vibrio vulnificus]